VMLIRDHEAEWDTSLNVSRCAHQPGGAPEAVLSNNDRRAVMLALELAIGRENQILDRLATDQDLRAGATSGNRSSSAETLSCGLKSCSRS
jgi:hypothetical protein